MLKVDFQIIIAKKKSFYDCWINSPTLEDEAKRTAVADLGIYSIVIHRVVLIIIITITLIVVILVGCGILCIGFLVIDIIAIIFSDVFSQTSIGIRSTVEENLDLTTLYNHIVEIIIIIMKLPKGAF